MRIEVFYSGRLYHHMSRSKNIVFSYSEIGTLLLSSECSYIENSHYSSTALFLVAQFQFQFVPQGL